MTDRGLRLGREPGNDIVVEDNGVSRQHARFILHNGGLWVQDVGSRNGVFVNDARVQAQSQLSVGDRVKIGESIFEIQVQDQEGGSLSGAHSPGFAPGSGKKKWKLWPFLVVAVVLVVLVILVAQAGGDGASRAEVTGPGDDAVVDLLLTATQKTTDVEAVEPVSSGGEQPADGSGATAPSAGSSGGSPKNLADLLRRDESESEASELDESFPPPPEGSSAAELVEKAHQLYRARRLHDALVAYHQAYSLDGDSEICERRIDRLNTEIASEIKDHFNAGLLYYNNLQYQQAVNEWEMVLLLDPDPESTIHQQTTTYLEKARSSIQRQY